MSLTLDQLKAALRVDFVPRFATHWVLKDDKVSQHSYRATLLYAKLGGTELLAMLTHDAPESVTGDLPSPSKKHLTGLDQFDYLSYAFKDPKEKRLGKLADKLDLVLVLKQQMEATGRLPKILMNIYEDELDAVMSIAKELNKTVEIKQLLKELA